MQTLQVYGDPILCCTHGCEQPATAMFRRLVDGEDYEQATPWCAEHWQEQCDAFWQCEMDVNCQRVVIDADDDDDARRSEVR